MLRALLERDIVPDLVLGTSVGALNGAMVARQPRRSRSSTGSPTCGPRPRRARDVYGDRPLRTVRRAVSTGTHIYSSGPLRARLEEELGDATFEDLPVRVRASARPASSAPPSTGSPPARSCRRSSRAPPCPACSRRPRRDRAGVEHFLDGGLVNSIPVGRAVELGADADLRAPGGPDRPSAHGAQAAVGGRAGELRGRPPPPLHARHGRRSPTASRRTSCPRAARRPATTRCAPTATSRQRPGHASTRRTTPRAPTSTAQLGRPTRRRCGSCAAGRGAGGGRPHRADVGDPAAAGSLVAAALSPCCRVAGGRCGCCGWCSSTSPSRRCCWRVLLGLWLASGFGWRIRSPYFAGIHYDLVQGTLVVFFREARRVLALRIRTDGPHPADGPERPVLVMLPPRGAGRLVHPDVRPAALVPPRAARRAQEHPRLGPGDRRDPAPDPGPASSRPTRRPGEDLESQIAALATGLDAQRRLRDLPRGRQLHRRRAATARSPGCASSAWSGWRCAPRR